MNNTFSSTARLQQANDAVIKKFMVAVYGWMVAALALSGIAAFWVLQSPAMLSFIFGSRFGFFVLVAVEFILVSVLVGSAQKISVPAALAAFAAYSIVNGMTLSSIFIIYAGSSVVRIFIIAALMFGAMSVYGMTTKNNLATAGHYFMMTIIGVVIASLVNLFLRSSSLDWLISFVSVGLFTGLTAYDSQKILRIGAYAQDNDEYKKRAVVGALELYLDFINLFLALLRLFAKRR